MLIEVLGCFGGVDPKHNPVTLLLDDKILLDAGSIVSVLPLERQKKIQSIFISHSHLDHIKDLCFLADNFIMMGKGPVNVYGIPEVLEMLKKYVMNNKIWPDFFEIKGAKGKKVLSLNPIEIGKPIKINGRYTIEAICTNHSIDSSGYLIGYNDKYFAYTGDTGPCPSLWERLNKVDNLRALFIEVSFPSQNKDLALITGHLTPSLLMEELKNLKNKKTKIYIFHIKPPFMDKIKEEFCHLSNKQVTLLEDGQKVKI
ncbi:MAG: 3',5'-cyclic-nucleotide phosphodiesterase [Proteobacteria bacterium]|nr:3',5'-cyclic-nucleotide phosphodiesterase [Pseudomonadota bacterium]